MALLVGGALIGSVQDAPAAVTCPDPGPCVIVQVLGTAPSTQFVTAADLQQWADVTEQNYPLRNLDGSTPPDDTISSGVSIGHLLAQLQIAPQSVTYTTAGSANSTYKSPLTTPDLLQPSPFADGLEPVVYLPSSDQLGYVRPLRGDNDANGRDHFQLPSNQGLELVVHTTGRVLHPTITAAQTKITVGDTDTFTTTVDNTTQTALTYQWTFGDGATDGLQGAQAGHQYTDGGTFYASVVVQGADGSWGQSSSVRVKVGKTPSPSPSPTVTTSPGAGGTGSSHNPSAGPTHGTGHHGGASPSTTTPHRSATPAPRTTHVAPTPSATSSDIIGEPPAGPATAAASTTARSGVVTHSVTTPPEQVIQSPTGSPANALTLVDVDGILIAGPAAPVASATAVTDDPSRPTAPAARPAAATHVDRAALWALLVPVLFGFGVVREMRRPAHRRTGRRR